MANMTSRRSLHLLKDIISAAIHKNTNEQELTSKPHFAFRLRRYQSALIKNTIWIGEIHQQISMFRGNVFGLQVSFQMSYLLKAGNSTLRTGAEALKYPLWTFYISRY